MQEPLPSSLPKSHRDFLEHAVEKLAQETWLVGIAATGSFVTDRMDVYSDLDFVLAVEEEYHSVVMENCISVAATLGPLLSAFTGQHVGVPQLLLCLYGPPLLHVDFIFDTLPNAIKRSEDLVVLWERDDRLSTARSLHIAVTQELDSQWFEDRFWVWVHKACGKIGRGEIFEALEYLTFLRSRVLGPLCLNAAGRQPTGTRCIELFAPSMADDLMTTVAQYGADDCLAALRAGVELYRRVRDAEGPALQYRHAAASAVIDYLTEIEHRIHINTIPA